MPSCTIVTKDEDFAIRRLAIVEGPKVIWIRRANTRRAAMITWLTALLPEAVSALDRGETLVEIA